MMRALFFALGAIAVGCSSGPNTDTATDAAAAGDAAGEEPDAVAVDAGGGDVGPPSGKVAVFVAQGANGRSIISCDNGQTWVGNHSWDIDGDALMCGIKQSVTCGQTTPACSYFVNNQCAQYPCCNGPGAGSGIAFGDNVFVTTWGHAAPAPIRTSSNGIDWVSSYLDFQTSVAFGGGRFVAGSNPIPLVSDDGMTWTKGTPFIFIKGTGFRHVAYGDYGGSGRFIAVGTAGGVGEPNPQLRDILISSDGALTWWRPTTLPSTCANGIGAGDIVSGNGTFVIIDEFGTTCRSTDGGQNWSVGLTPAAAVTAGLIASVTSGSNGIWTGTEFTFWGSNTMITSTDGASWTATPMSTKTAIGWVARSDSGTLVTVVHEYASQQFLRSIDGLTWDTLPGAAIVQGHPLGRIVFGYADPSGVCAQ